MSSGYSWTDVYAAELEEIAARRRHQAGEPEPDTPPPPPTRLPDLTGLAVSGGGIRSATFNLGVIQALAKAGILQHIDYLSTVSGGGYIGSALSSFVNGTDQSHASVRWGSQFPFHQEAGKEEAVPIRHLRDFSNYLAPRGLAGLVQMPALLLRGFVTNLSVVIPLVLFSAIFFAVVWGDLIERTTSPFRLYVLTPYAFGAAALLALASLGAWSSSQAGRNRLRRFWVGIALVPVIVLTVETLPVATAVFLDWSREAAFPDLKAIVALAAGILPVVFAGKAAEKASKLGGQLALAAIGLLAPFVLLLFHSYLASRLIQTRNGGYAIQILIAVGVGGVLTIAWNVLRYDANHSSMLSFYRDRLSAAYLRTWTPGDASTRDNNEQKLSTLESRGPYHIVNTTMNLQGSSDLTLHGRQSKVFVLSKRFCGYTDSDGSHYARTRDMEWIDPYLNLGTAMSISAAAAGPNMGMITLGPLVFLMAILNVRLGYWLRNPDRCPERPEDGAAGPKPPRMKPGARYLVKEMTGSLDAARDYVNLTDGGHLENLGVYELLRRRCKLIIACDAEADPNYEFMSLARVIRFARIDWGIDIEIDVTDLKKGNDGRSLKSWAVGRIRYSKEETGYLLYVKSSLLGNENQYIKTYSAKHPDFPHESTADQFFSEEQFESYRALGHKVASTLCERVHPERFVQKANRLHEWVEELEAPLRSRGSLESELVGLQDELNALEHGFNDPDVAAYTAQVYPELRLGNSYRTDLQKIFWLCIRQLNFMENVFVQLSLDQHHQREHHFNRGWMNLFRRWAAASFFVDAWTIAIGDYSVSFERFCKDVLNLRLRLEMDEVHNDQLRARLTDDLWDICQVKNREGTTYVGVVRADDRLTKSFPAGFVVVDERAGDPTVVLYAVSERYRGMYYLAGMFGQMVMKKPRLRVRLTKEDRARFSSFFQKLNIPMDTPE